MSPRMKLRTRYSPSVYTVTDEDTGEVLAFTLWGELKHVRLFSISSGRTRKSAWADYVPFLPE